MLEDGFRDMFDTIRHPDLTDGQVPLILKQMDETADRFEPSNFAIHVMSRTVRISIKQQNIFLEEKMEYTQLGRTGLKVSRLCLGTMNFGPKTTEEDSFAIMDKAHDLGINFFDTANVYGWKLGEGVTEQIVGRWFAQGGGRREKTVHRDKGLWSHGRLAQSIAALGVEHSPGCGRFAQTTADRSHRSVPDASHRPQYALGGDLAGDGNACPAGQDFVCGFIQLCGLAYCQSQ